MKQREGRKGKKKEGLLFFEKSDLYTCMHACELDRWLTPCDLYRRVPTVAIFYEQVARQLFLWWRAVVDDDKIQYGTCIPLHA